MSLHNLTYYFYPDDKHEPKIFKKENFVKKIDDMMHDYVKIKECVRAKSHGIFIVT